MFELSTLNYEDVHNRNYFYINIQAIENKKKKIKCSYKLQYLIFMT